MLLSDKIAVLDALHAKVRYMILRYLVSNPGEERTVREIEAYLDSFQDDTVDYEAVTRALRNLERSGLIEQIRTSNGNKVRCKGQYTDALRLIISGTDAIMNQMNNFAAG